MIPNEVDARVHPSGLASFSRTEIIPGKSRTIQLGGVPKN